jgi:hypothetical protein
MPARTRIQTPTIQCKQRPLLYPVTSAAFRQNQMTSDGVGLPSIRPATQQLYKQLLAVWKKKRKFN